ncbi:flagellar hook assembly protein FlgD [Thiohalobacter thiocyanaticus]|uniref:Basal-body rod modification protein FlgD n=1 Tax=Thiohalobacter thiocyanaticus TaxID=585455 RepID=A0A426QGT0_9GAMM|nr:flagellar hook assembly protein FlgD [Thiohalobacter thiocyanaticus]RRQ20943.1 flagellar hook assembly protein FlgD [Thiohalobacter thiocyanaticus]
MNDISSLQDIYAGAGLRTSEEASRAESKVKNELGQEDFLDLMVAQLRNQDPMKPMEDGEFLTQMAQFSTSTGIQELKDSFKSFSESMQSGQTLQAASLVGRSVLAPTGVGRLEEGGSLSGSIDLPESSSDVEVRIFNQAGELVRSIGLGQQAAGTVPFKWEGMDDQGQPLPAGDYLVEASANTGNGAEAVETLIATEVENVTLNRSGGLLLGLNGGRTLELSEVRQIQ